MDRPPRERAHEHEHRVGDATGHGHGRPGQSHGEMVAANRAAARQLLPAALAEIEARAALPLEAVPLPEFASHLDAIVRAAHAALFLRQVVEED